MDYSVPTEEGFPWKSLLLGVAMTLLVIGMSMLFIKYYQTRPLAQGFANYKEKNEEGFAAVNGVSLVPCGRDLGDGEKLFSLFVGRDLSNTEDGKKDLDNLRNLLAKLACMKRDLLSPSGLISAEKELQFCTYSDIQPSQETTSRCLSKQIPERDLEIQFEKWRQYGTDLIYRLCTAAKLSEQEVVQAERLFDSAHKDVFEISKVKCLTGKPIGAEPGPHEPGKYMPNDIKNLSEYEGYKSTFF